MNENQELPSREQRIYWQEFVQLKADTCYIRDYRNSLNRYVTGIAAIRAVASTGSIAAWAVWKRFSYVWASIIAASQVVDALRNVFPFYKRRRMLSRWCRTLNKLFIEAQRDWEQIAIGKCTNRQISKLTHQLRLKKQRAEAKYIPDGLSRRDDLFSSAEQEAARFFRSRYGSIED